MAGDRFRPLRADHPPGRLVERRSRSGSTTAPCGARAIAAISLRRRAIGAGRTGDDDRPRFAPAGEPGDLRLDEQRAARGLIDEADVRASHEPAIARWRF